MKQHRTSDGCPFIECYEDLDVIGETPRKYLYFFKCVDWMNAITFGECRLQHRPKRFKCLFAPDEIKPGPLCPACCTATTSAWYSGKS